MSHRQQAGHRPSHKNNWNTGTERPKTKPQQFAENKKISVPEERFSAEAWGQLSPVMKFALINAFLSILIVPAAAKPRRTNPAMTLPPIVDDVETPMTDQSHTPHSEDRVDAALHAIGSFSTRPRNQQQPHHHEGFAGADLFNAKPDEIPHLTDPRYAREPAPATLAAPGEQRESGRLRMKPGWGDL